MSSKEEEEVAAGAEGAATSPAPGGDDSSDSDGETEPARSFHRKISTNKHIKCSVCIKEGYLMKQTSSFQRWKRRYFKLKGNKLYYAKDTKYVVFDEIELIDLSIAETSAKSGGGHCFQVITAFRCFTLSADTRRDMEEWTAALKSASKRQFFEGMDHLHTLLSGQHNWHVMSHARPTYCNVCREALSGVTSHGLSCEVCKFKCHKRCAARDTAPCKWTTLASVGSSIIEDEDRTLSMPHQWLEGNLSVSARCMVCDRTCGSVLRLQDWRCLWCRATVHATCRTLVPPHCPLGVCKVSIVPPTALHSIGADDSWEAARPQGCSPLLVFVNSKSGDHQGIKFLRRFKQLLNPAQVFDLMNSGPALGLRLFKAFDQFRILVCGGDGSISWVLSHIDKFDMHRQCQVGVLPLGTGNDLARVLGWGAACDDDANLAHILEKYECATIKMLDRWSISAMSTTVRLSSAPPVADTIASYEDSVAEHLAHILQSERHPDVLQSASVLCETVRDLISRVADSAAASPRLAAKCVALDEKLSQLMVALREEARPTRAARRSSRPSGQQTPRSAILLRANSLKKAIRGILAHVESAIDDQNWETASRAEAAAAGAEQPADSEDAAEPDDTDSGNPEEEGDAQEEREPSLATDEEREQEETDAGSEPSVRMEEQREEEEEEEEEGIAQTEWQMSVHGASPLTSPLASPMVSPYRMPSSMTTTFPVRPWSPGGAAGRPPPWLPPSPLLQPAQAASRRTAGTGDTDTNGLLCPTAAERRPSAEISQLFLTPDDGKAAPEAAHPLSISPLPAVGGGEPLPEPLPAPSLFADSAVHLSINSSAGSLLDAYDDEPVMVEQKSLSGDEPIPPIQIQDASPPQPGEEEEEEAAAGCSESAEVGAAPPPSADAARRVSSLCPPAGSAASASPDGHRRTPIINPLVCLPAWPNVTSAGGGLVQNVLLAHADALCAAASPLVAMQHTLYRSGFEEKGVMNNYFGIGIDAKISLDFHNKREGNPQKCRSRTKNFMWYGVLGSKELIQKTYKNLEQRVKLECDGHVIPLPSLQGIVVLNIPSFMGGTNFWGRWREEDCFLLPSFDDRILEVVAVFGTVQMAASRIINLQHHRIAQCQTVQITILGEEDVPVEVDGEAWVQQPGVIKITHKNRVQMLSRNRSLEASLRTWQEKQQRRQSVTLGASLTDDEQILLRELIESSLHFIRASKLFVRRYGALPGGAELREAVTSTAAVLERLAPPASGTGQPSIAELGANRPEVSDLVAAVRSLHSQVADFMHECSTHINLCGGLEEQLVSTMVQLEAELRHAQCVHGAVQFTAATEPAEVEKQRRPSRGGLFRLRLRREGRCAAAAAAAAPSPGPSPAPPAGPSVVAGWQTEDVVAWLDSISLPEYRNNFIRHDVRGPELLSLERRDLKELGIVKIGHIKRIQQAIKEIRNTP